MAAGGSSATVHGFIFARNSLYREVMRVETCVVTLMIWLISRHRRIIKATIKYGHLPRQPLTLLESQAANRKNELSAGNIANMIGRRQAYGIIKLALINIFI